MAYIHLEMDAEPISEVWAHILLILLQPMTRSLQISSAERLQLNPLNAELNPIRHLLALVGARHIVHVSWIRVKVCSKQWWGGGGAVV